MISHAILYEDNVDAPTERGESNNVTLSDTKERTLEILNTSLRFASLANMPQEECEAIQQRIRYESVKCACSIFVHGANTCSFVRRTIESVPETETVRALYAAQVDVAKCLGIVEAGLQMQVEADESELALLKELQGTGLIVRMVEEKADGVLKECNVETKDANEAMSMYSKIFQCEGCIARIIDDQNELENYERKQVPEGMCDLFVPRGNLLETFRQAEARFA